MQSSVDSTRMRLILTRVSTVNSEVKVIDRRNRSCAVTCISLAMDQLLNLIKHVLEQYIKIVAHMIREQRRCIHVTTSEYAIEPIYEGI